MGILGALQHVTLPSFGMMCSISQLTGAHPFLSLFFFSCHRHHMECFLFSDLRSFCYRYIIFFILTTFILFKVLLTFSVFLCFGFVCFYGLCEIVFFVFIFHFSFCFCFHFFICLCYILISL